MYMFMRVCAYKSAFQLKQKIEVFQYLPSYITYHR